MTNRVDELAAILREHGPEYLAQYIADEMRDAPPTDRVTTEDAYMQMYGRGPDIEIIDD